MASLSKPFPVWYIALFLMLATNIRVHSQTETNFAFSRFDSNADGALTFQADAHVPSNSRFLRLTKSDSSGGPTRNSVGRVVYTPPLQFWSPTRRQLSFVTNFQFVVTPSKDGAADGLAFFIAPVNSTVGGAGTNFGVFNGNGRFPNIFAVEFDTYSWGDFDPDYLHIGIDIESKYSVNTTKFDSGTGEVVSATIIYNSRTKEIIVNAITASQRASVRYIYDLGSILPQQVQVGISASNGGTLRINGVFNLLNWSFSSLLRATTDAATATTTATSIRETETYSPQHLAV